MGMRRHISFKYGKIYN